MLTEITVGTGIRKGNTQVSLKEKIFARTVVAG